MFPFERDLQFQLERSPFSEEITVHWGGEYAEPVELVTLDGTVIKTLSGDDLVTLGGEAGVGIVLKGIFDESAEREPGNKATRVKPRVYVFCWLRRTPPGTRVTIRGKEYGVTSHESDANLGIVVWLR